MIQISEFHRGHSILNQFLAFLHILDIILSHMSSVEAPFKSTEKISVPAEAFADAMIFGFVNAMKVDFSTAYNKGNPIDTSHNRPLTPTLEAYSISKCGIASILTAEYLLTRYPTQFEYILLLYSNVGPFIEPTWSYHQYTIAKEQATDTWYAGSAANYNLLGKADPPSEMFQGNLQSVIYKIHKHAGGRWALPYDIQAALCDYEQPEIKRGKWGERAKIFTIGSLAERKKRRLYDVHQSNSLMVLYDHRGKHNPYIYAASAFLINLRLKLRKKL